MRAVPLGPSVGLPTSHETLNWVWRTPVAAPTGAADGAPYGATKRCVGCGGRMWPPPLGPEVELPMGPRNAVL
eukprot:4870049-Pyramimonas_sp.AAC.1